MERLILAVMAILFYFALTSPYETLTWIGIFLTIYIPIKFIWRRAKRRKIREEIEAEIAAFERSNYAHASGNDYWTTMNDTGLIGEFNIFKEFERMEEKHILTNLYIPKENGTTAEIDLLVVNTKGIHVIESKNYTGKIIGDEKYDKWIQIARKKSRFYSPFLQNANHILALKNFLPEIDDQAFTSNIIFGDSCVIEKMIITTPGVIVCQLKDFEYRYYKMMYLRKDILTPEQVEQIYERLKVASLASPETKAKHVMDAKHSKKRWGRMIHRRYYSK